MFFTFSGRKSFSSGKLSKPRDDEQGSLQREAPSPQEASPDLPAASSKLLSLHGSRERGSFGVASSLGAAVHNGFPADPRAAAKHHQMSTTSEESTYSTCGHLDATGQSNGGTSLSLELGKDPQGLTVVWEPRGPRALDIVLVHGLGGTSRSTWSKGKDPSRS